jgi:hypothetical protein
LAVGAGLAAEAALWFSAVHLGGGGLAGLPQEIKNATTNEPRPHCKISFLIFVIHLPVRIGLL